MLPSLFERSLEFNCFYKYNRTSKFFNHFKAKVNFSETKFFKYNNDKFKLGRLVLNHSTNIEGLIPILQKLALDINIKLNWVG